MYLQKYKDTFEQLQSVNYLLFIIPFSELPRIERNSGGFRTFNNLVKIQFTDKIDSIFVILVKFRSYIHFPVHSYVFNTPAIAVTSSSTYLLFYIIRTFQRIPTNSYNRYDSILLVNTISSYCIKVFIDIIRRSLYERFAILALCPENLVLYQYYYQ